MMKTSELFIRAIGAAEEVVAVALSKIGDPTITGGYLCVAYEFGYVLGIALIGEVKEGEVGRHLTLCQEKALRLARHSNYVSSAQDLNELAGQYGGAIRAGNFIFSFSGLPTENWDEACMVATAIKTLPPGSMSRDRVELIRGVNNNEHIAELLQVV